MVTANELRAMVVQTLRGEIGYTSGTYSYSQYGKASYWRSEWLGGIREWQGLYCGRFASWGPDKVMGARAAVAAIGLQGYALPAGWAATWYEYAFAKSKGRLVAFKDAKPADRILFKLPGRPLNPTNHIGTFVRWHIPGKVMVVVEGNLPRPGYGTSTIGVWEHYRDATYVVAVHSPDYEAAAEIYNAENPEEDEMSDEQYNALRDLIERVDAKVDKSRGEALTFHEREMAEAERHEKQLNVVGRVAAEARDGNLTEDDIVKAIFTHKLQGLSFDWWVRNGLVLDKDHRQYPADPGSLADLIMQIATKLDIEFTPYDGTQKRPIPSVPHTEE